MVFFFLHDCFCTHKLNTVLGSPPFPRPPRPFLCHVLFPDQFDKLADQLLDLPMDSLRQLRTLVQAVFDKALDEPNFVDMYADLCVRLNERSTSWSFVKVTTFFALGEGGCVCA